MSLNWKEIDLVLTELDLPGRSVQKVRQPDFKSLIIELFKPGDPLSLYICLGSGETRLHRLSRKLPAADTLQRFAQMLRSRIGGGRISEARQIGEDRIVLLKVVRAGEETELWIRLWGGAANIIVTDPDGVIIDAFYRRPGKGEVSGGVYRPLEEIEKSKRSGSTKVFSVREIGGDGDFNGRIERHYFDHFGEESRERLREKAAESLERDLTALESLLEKLIARRAEFDLADSYRKSGDILLSSLHLIKPGDTWLDTVDFYDDDRPIRIELDPRAAPEQNAEMYFLRYRKAKAGRDHIEEEIADTRRRIGEAESRIAALLRSPAGSDTGELTGIVRHPPRRQSSEGGKGDPPGLRYVSGEYPIYVGRTSIENDELLRSWVKGNDYWLHTRDYPGGYVFIRTQPKKSVPLDVLLDAGNLALFYSKGRASGRGELYYTQVKYLRRAKDGKRGTVLPTREKNLSIRLDEARLKRMMDSKPSP